MLPVTDFSIGIDTPEITRQKVKEAAEFQILKIKVGMDTDQLDDLRWLHQRASLPLMGDESCRHPADIPKLVGVFDALNFKLDKTGGMTQAYMMIQWARSLGFKTMLGCMVSSSCSITAAAHLSPLVDYADLDGNLLVANDPYRGVTVKAGKLILPNRPGLGLISALISA
jgi:L-Ala-D/L-Glu epimerase